MVKSVGLRDCKVKLVVCTPLADDGFPNTIIQKAKTNLYFRFSGTSIYKGEDGSREHAEDDLCL